MSQKRRSSIGIVCALLLPGLLLCAEGAPTTLAAGTRLRVEFNMAVGTAISRVNDGVEVHLLKPVLAAGREVLPVGTILSGRVLSVRKGDKHTHTIPMLRLGFDTVTLPDGREFTGAASLADLGMMLKVDSEGAAMTEKRTTGERVGGVAASGGIGAGVGGIAGGGKGAATGAAIGTGIGVLGDLATRGIEYEDFTLKKGRKAWLRLDADLFFAPPRSHAGDGEDTQGAAASVQLPQGPVAPTTDEKASTLLPRHPSTLTHAPSSASSTASNLEGPLRSIVLGEWRATPIYVDTGPFASAEQAAYWTASGTQFVIVTNKFESLYNLGTPCSISRVRLQVNTGREYPPLREQPEDPNGSMPDEVRVPVWVFKVSPGEKPLGLLVTRPPQDTGKCPDGYASPWPKLRTDRVVLSLENLPSRNDIANVLQHSAPVRLGQLEITITSVGLGSGEGSGVGIPTPKHGHHPVVISLAIRNVSEDPNCTQLHWAVARLFGDRGYEYSYPAYNRLWGSVNELLPGETTGGNMTFEVYHGDAPKVLSVSRDVGWERSCADKQHRPVDMHGGSMVRIPITGVPGISSAGHR